MYIRGENSKGNRRHEKVRWTFEQPIVQAARGGAAQNGGLRSNTRKPRMLHHQT